MTFTYPELTTVEHDKQRWYLTPSGAYYPSITTILGHTEPVEKKASLENWRSSLGHAKADEISRQAAAHGTNVHLLAERFLKGEKVTAPINGKPVPLPDLDAFNALKLKLKKIDEVWGQEVTLYSTALEVAGRCDLVGVYKQKPNIIDFKTVRKVKSRADIDDYALQLAFYGICHNEMFSTDIHDGVILMVAEAGFPLEFNIDLTEQRQGLEKRVKEFWRRVINNLIASEKL